MSFLSLFRVVLALFWIGPAAAQTGDSGARLVERFKQSKPFFAQIEVARQIISLGNADLLEDLKDMLSSEDRHARANAAFVFAGLGDIRGLETVANILQDRSYRPEGQGIGIAPGDGKYHVERQIAADRYYAVHVLGELKDARAIPILTPLLQDSEINYKAAWALGQTGDRAAIIPLIEALKITNPNVRVIAIQSLQRLQAKEALPVLHRLLEDNERSTYGAAVTVAETAKAAIAALETN